MIAQQALHDAFYKLSDSLGYKTFTSRPPQETSYPFVTIEYTQEIGVAVKHGRMARLPMTASVWGLFNDRKAVSEIADNLIKSCENGLEGGFTLNRDDVSVSMMIDDSTNTKLYRAVMELSFKLS